MDLSWSSSGLPSRRMAPPIDTLHKLLLVQGRAGKSCSVDLQETFRALRCLGLETSTRQISCGVWRSYREVCGTGPHIWQWYSYLELECDKVCFLLDLICAIKCSLFASQQCAVESVHLRAARQNYFLNMIARSLFSS